MNDAAKKTFDRVLAEAKAETLREIGMYQFGWCQGMLVYAYQERKITIEEYETAANEVTQALAEWRKLT